MTVITGQQISELRQLADRAKVDGHFDEGELLHTLLDAFEERDATQEKLDELESDNKDLKEKVDAVGKALEKLTRLDESLSEVRSTLEDAVA